MRAPPLPAYLRRLRSVRALSIVIPVERNLDVEPQQLGIACHGVASMSHVTVDLEQHHVFSGQSGNHAGTTDSSDMQDTRADGIVSQRIATRDSGVERRAITQH